MIADTETDDSTTTDFSETFKSSPDLNIFSSLGEAYSGIGRAQLTYDQKDGFAEPLAAAANIPRSNIDIRALSDEKQTRRALSESTFSRIQSDIEMLDWVFVGRCTGEEESYPKILSYMGENVQILAGVSVFLGARPEWRVIGMYYDDEKKESATKIAARLGYDFGNAVCIKVRDRRNLTKNISDYDDPLSPDVFMNDAVRDRMIAEIMRKKCIAIQGPPGTGKTVIGKSIALKIAGDKTRVLSLQFHQSYSYEDFIRGWRPSDAGNLELKDGIFIRFCHKAKNDPGNPHVVFIDEINRANVSQVFGEVLSLIEATKRDPKFAVDLAYAHTGDSTGFFIPNNVFFIATMNTADRSLALVDYALRRRFSFIDLGPAYGSDEFLAFLEGNGLDRKIGEEISKRMTDLNSVISSDSRNLGPGFIVGHSYFCGKIPDATDYQKWYRNIIDHEIAPLLKEYWAEEPTLADERISLLSADFSQENIKSSGL